MKLIEISAQGLKGLTFTNKLEDINLVTGDNFTGKTARLDAILLLLVGYHPKLGKTNAATFSLCNGRELIVRGTFDDGSTMMRRWHTSKDSVKTEALIPPSIEQLGSLLAVMCSAQSYFGLSDRERVDFVFKNVPRDGEPLTIPILIQSVSDHLIKLNDGVDLEKEPEKKLDPKRVDAFLDSMTTALDDRCRKARRDEFDDFLVRPDAFVEFALQYTVDQTKAQKDHAARMDKTLQGLTGLRLGDKDVIDIPALDAEKKKLEAELKELQIQHANAKAASDQARKSERRWHELRKELLNKDLVTGRLNTLKKNLEAKQTELAGMPNPTHEDIQSYYDEESKINGDLRVARDQLAALQADYKALVAELNELGEKETCPYCGAAGTGWKLLKDAELNDRMTNNEDKRRNLESDIRTMEPSLKRVVDLRSAKQRQGYDRKPVQAAVWELEKDIAAVEIQMAGFAPKEQELVAMAYEPDTGRDDAQNETQERIYAKEGQLLTVSSQIRSGLAREGEHKRLAQAEKERTEAQMDQRIAQGAQGAIRDLKAKLVDETFRPLLRIANSIFRPLVKSDLEVLDNVIGTWRDGTFVPHSTFSGVEELLAYASIQIALAAKSPIKLMLLDELGDLTDQRRKDLWICVTEAIEAKTIDQFVGVYPTDDADSVEVLLPVNIIKV